MQVLLDDCWLWDGHINGGYGRVNLNGRMTYVHVAAYEALVGPVPEGLELDHLCRTKDCYNPRHLEPVTHTENVRRAMVNGPNHCPAMHEYTPENSYFHSRGDRQCRACNRARYHARKAKRVA